MPISSSSSSSCVQLLNFRSLYLSIALFLSPTLPNSLSLSFHHSLFLILYISLSLPFSLSLSHSFSLYLSLFSTFLSLILTTLSFSSFFLFFSSLLFPLFFLLLYFSLLPSLVPFYHYVYLSLSLSHIATIISHQLSFYRLIII